MFNLGNQKINLKCGCGRTHLTNLTDVSNRRSIKCMCGVTIQLQDNGGSMKKGISNVNKSINDLDKLFKKLGR